VTGCPTIVLRNLVDALIAIILGNLIYFFVLMPLLPPVARHETFRIDIGLAIDFGVCVAVYGALTMLARYKTTRSRRQ
jgi:H+/gluconate symporter-like permease